MVGGEEGMMTTEEAKEIIIKERDSLKANPIVKVEDCLYEAFDMAIKALEEVSRLPENLHREREQAYMNGYADAKSTCRWISVDDKLPEENQRVLVIYRPMIGDTDEVDVDYIKGEYWQNHGGVIAWMPLPEWEGMEYDEERNTMTIKKSAYDDAVERIDKSTFTLHDGLDCVETLVALEAVMIASAQAKPCEDCISRQAVLDMATTIQTDDFSGNEIIEVVDIDDIKELPSVTPTRPTGHWILKRTFPTKMYDEYLNEYECSECHRGIRCTDTQLVNYPYCHCGTRMAESEVAE